MEGKIKVVGKRLKKPDSPEACFRRAEALIRELNRLNPFPKPRGFVKKFRTYEDYHKWRAEHKNPRLW